MVFKVAAKREFGCVEYDVLSLNVHRRHTMPARNALVWANGVEVNVCLETGVELNDSSARMTRFAP